MTSSTISTENGKVLPAPEVDEGRASGEPLKIQHLVIDFTPLKEDEGEVAAKCVEFLELVGKHNELRRLMVVQKAERKLFEDSESSILKSCSSVERENKEYGTAVNAIKKLEQNGALKAAIGS